MPRTARASVGGYCYHALNRSNERARVFHGAGVTTQTAFDKDGNVTKSVVHGYTTTGQFDADNNQTASVDGDGNTTAYAFDAADQLTKVTDPDANATTYGLDGDGLTTLVTSPQGYTTQQKFDGDGNITQRITPDGGTVNFTYDGDGRLTSDGNGTRTYNGDGSLTTASNAYGTTGVESGKWRVESGEWPLSTLHSPLSTRAVGNQTLVTDSLGGTESSTYDGDGYLTARSYVGQGQTLLVKYTNNEEGWNTTLARYSNLAGTTLVATSKYQYDGAGNVTNVQDTGPSGGAIDQFAYALDSNGNLTSETDTQGGTATTTDYSYDSAGQLTSAGGSSYGYDANGNRDTGSDTVTTGNEMTADANWDYKYDKEGELIEKDSTVVGSSEKWTYTWSANGNLTEAKHYNSSGTLVLDVTYEYDAFGEMIQKSDGTVTSRYVQDGWNSNMTAPTGNENMNTWAVLNGSNQWQERDIWGNQVGQELGRIVLSANNYTLYPMQDRQQSVRDVIIANGTVEDSIAYDAFGNITSETNSAYRGNYAWTGRQVDVETGLQYNHARWYDPKMGRWISQDPLGFDAGDSNLYRYCMNKPSVEIDPSGQQGGGNATELNHGKNILSDVKIALPDGKFAILSIRSGVNVKDGKLPDPIKNTLAIKIDGVLGIDVDFLQYGWLSDASVFYKGSDKPRYKSGVIQTTSGAHKTGMPENPDWFLDTGLKYDKNLTENKYYSRAFLRNRGKTSLTIYDRPGFPEPFLAAEIKDPNVTRIDYTANYITYIMLDGKQIGGPIYWQVYYRIKAPKFDYKDPDSYSYLAFYGAPLAYLNSKGAFLPPSAAEQKNAITRWQNPQ